MEKVIRKKKLEINRWMINEIAKILEETERKIISLKSYENGNLNNRPPQIFLKK